VAALFLGMSIVRIFSSLVVTLTSECKAKDIYHHPVISDSSDCVILIAMSNVLVEIGSIVATQIISIVLQSDASKDLHVKLKGRAKIR
jgi:hypothetical protein